jgi:hypothetical protein
VSEKKKKKGFKKCTSLAVPAGVSTLMENMQIPMKEMESMFSEGTATTETVEPIKFHSLSL